MLLFFASAFAFPPTTARAEWVDIGTGSYRYFVDSTSISVSNLHASTITAQDGLYGYSTTLSLNSIYTHGNSYTDGQCWNTKPGNSSPVLVRFAQIAGGELAKDRRIQISVKGNITFKYSTNANPSYSSDYLSVTRNCSNFRYFVSNSTTGGTEIFPDQYGTFILPINAQNVYVVCQVALSLSSGVQVYGFQNSEYFKVRAELPDDQNEVDAINDQTDTFMSTDGSDTVVSGTNSSANSTINNMNLYQSVQSMLSGFWDSFYTTDASQVVLFPGISLMGFTIDAASVNVFNNLPIPINYVRMVVTFIFCSAFISHIIHLLQAIFGIYDYGLGVEDFSNGTLSYKDYTADDDLGF